MINHYEVGVKQSMVVQAQPNAIVAIIGSLELFRFLQV